MKIVDNRIDVIKKATEFYENLKGDIYILGTNKYGACIAAWLIQKGHKVSGYINDYIKDEEYAGLKVYRSVSVPVGNNIVNCIVEGRVTDAMNNIYKLNPSAQIDYFALQLAYPDELLQIDFLDGTSSVLEREDEYVRLYSILEDEQSKAEFHDIVHFRLNRDIKYLHGFKFRLKEQYFEQFIKFDSSPVFIDGGGFDGATSKMFCTIYPDYRKVYYFEPSETSMLKSKENLRDFKNIEYYQKGLWNKDEVLFFDDTLGSASRLTDLGKIRIETTSIDRLVKDKVNYIKLDIEGAEINALIGVENTIRKWKPIIAVCVYHKQNDFIDIPELLLRFNPEYKIFLRHYTQGVFETVMYFI